MNWWRHNNDVIIKKNSVCMFKIKFPTKRIFRIFHILRINGMAPFCNLFMERPSYYHDNSAYSSTEPQLHDKQKLASDLCAGLRSIPTWESCCEPLCTAYWSHHPSSHHHTGRRPTSQSHLLHIKYSKRSEISNLHQQQCCQLDKTMDLIIVPRAHPSKKFHPKIRQNYSGSRSWIRPPSKSERLVYTCLLYTSPSPRD